MNGTVLLYLKQPINFHKHMMTHKMHATITDAVRFNHLKNNSKFI